MYQDNISNDISFSSICMIAMLLIVYCLRGKCSTSIILATKNPLKQQNKTQDLLRVVYLFSEVIFPIKILNIKTRIALRKTHFLKSTLLRFVSLYFT